MEIAENCKKKVKMCIKVFFELLSHLNDFDRKAVYKKNAY